MKRTGTLKFMKFRGKLWPNAKPNAKHIFARVWLQLIVNVVCLLSIVADLNKTANAHTKLKNGIKMAVS